MAIADPRDPISSVSTSGINVAAAAHVAKVIGPGETIVTILCDGGSRYQSRLFNPEWLAAKGLVPRSGNRRQLNGDAHGRDGAQACHAKLSPQC